MDDIPLSWLFGTLAVLLLVSGFFSIAETSMMALNRYQVRHRAREGNRAARLTLELLDRTDRLLGVILLGNNLINSASSVLATVICVRLFGEGEITLMIATGGITFFILVFSEITPKVVGATSFKLAAEKIRNLEKLSPDMILLTGGMDSGDSETILHNARMLAQSRLTAPIVVAGNRAAGREASEVLERGGKEFRLIDNVMPRAGTLAVEAARAGEAGRSNAYCSLMPAARTTFPHFAISDLTYASNSSGEVDILARDTVITVA